MRTTCIHPRAIETDQKTVYDIRGATCISDAVFVVFANAFYRNLIWKMCSFAAGGEKGGKQLEANVGLCHHLNAKLVILLESFDQHSETLSE